MSELSFALSSAGSIKGILRLSRKRGATDTRGAETLAGCWKTLSESFDGAQSLHWVYRSDERRDL